MHTMTSPRRQQGATLLEVLVAFLILTFGLLGLAGMQITALKNNQSALQRSQASVLAHFMMDAMRANRASALAGDYNLGNPATNAPVCTSPAGVNLHTRDQAEWFIALKANLGNVPSTCGLIHCANNICRVRVVWDDSRGTGGAVTQMVEINSLL